MQKTASFLCLLMLFTSLSFAQAPSMLFYNGEVADGMYIWPAGFQEDPVPVLGSGYTPGNSALRWVTYNEGSDQYLFIGLESNEGIDLNSIWNTDSVYFKLKAPNGLAASDTLYIWLYDSRNVDWDYALYTKLENFHEIEDGSWHHFRIALADFNVNVNDINKSDIVAVSFEATGGGIASEMYIDHVWIGDPFVRHNLTIWNGKAVAKGVGTESWGFQDNNFKTAEGEGYAPGTNAVIWENGQDDWAGIGFYFDNQDMTDTWLEDSIKIKINAPAGINDPNLVFYDPDWNYAYYTLSGISWDGTWKVFSVPLYDFSVEGNLDLTKIYYFSVESYSVIAERFLITDIWVGNPMIDFLPPPTPENVVVDVSTPFVNLIAWDNIVSESGETYDVYASMNPITDLNAAGVYKVATDLNEEEIAVHNIYFPLANGIISYYYAVTCKDAAGNKSESFGTTGNAFANTGKKRAIISMEPPASFNADGNLNEWNHIVPFSLHPDSNLYTGVIENELDYSAECYVAMDKEFLYVAFDVFDDVFSWMENNTQPWWEDESIEFFIGLYEFTSHHPYFYRGAEPDYRLLFLPDKLELWSGDSLLSGSENYLFEPLGNADYVIEARIPFSMIQVNGDSSFTPEKGMTIPFEIFAADADVVDGGNESRLQLGDNSALNPWGDGPEVWTFAWIGMPVFTALEKQGITEVLTYDLRDNYPNPFNPSTTIEYALAQSGNIELVIYNSLGQTINTLVDAYQSAGRHKINFDASGLASGIYYYKIISGNFSQVKKMLFIK